MGRDIRITVKRRAEIDVDKLVFALLRVIEAQQPATLNQPVPHKTNGGGGGRSGEETAA